MLSLLLLLLPAAAALPPAAERRRTTTPAVARRRGTSRVCGSPDRMVNSTCVGITPVPANLDHIRLTDKERAVALIDERWKWPRAAMRRAASDAPSPRCCRRCCCCCAPVTVLPLPSDLAGNRRRVAARGGGMAAPAAPRARLRSEWPVEGPMPHARARRLVTDGVGETVGKGQAVCPMGGRQRRRAPAELEVSTDALRVHLDRHRRLAREDAAGERRRLEEACGGRRAAALGFADVQGVALIHRQRHWEAHRRVLYAAATGGGVGRAVRRASGRAGGRVLPQPFGQVGEAARRVADVETAVTAGGVPHRDHVADERILAVAAAVAAAVGAHVADLDRHIRHRKARRPRRLERLRRRDLDCDLAARTREPARRAARRRGRWPSGRGRAAGRASPGCRGAKPPPPQPARGSDGGARRCRRRAAAVKRRGGAPRARGASAAVCCGGAALEDGNDSTPPAPHERRKRPPPQPVGAQPDRPRLNGAPVGGAPSAAAMAPARRRAAAPRRAGRLVRGHLPERRREVVPSGDALRIGRQVDVDASGGGGGGGGGVSGVGRVGGGRRWPPGAHRQRSRAPSSAAGHRSARRSGR